MFRAGTRGYETPLARTPMSCPMSLARQARSTGGVFDHVVACVDGLFVKAQAPSAVNTPNVLAYYSGSKSGYGLNVQAMCTADYRFCGMSCIAPGATNDWVAWHQSNLSAAVDRLPQGYHILGDAAYPTHEKILTPYPGRDLPPGHDSFNYHLSQLRIEVEQSFGILVSTWGILWKPLRVQFAGRADLIRALFRLHNFLRDEQVTPVSREEESELTGRNRPELENGVLPTRYKVTSTENSKRTRSGETPSRYAVRIVLEGRRQFRPACNVARNVANKV